MRGGGDFMYFHVRYCLFGCMSVSITDLCTFEEGSTDLNGDVRKII